MKKNIITFLFATCLLVGCSSNPGSNPPEPDIKSVTLLTDPDKTEYTVGEFFAPSGLSVTVIDKSDVSMTVTYVGNESFFTFEPSLTTPLTADMTEVKATYEGFNVSIAIEVNENLNKVTLDFTTKRTKDDSNIPTQGNTGNDNLYSIIDHYYVASEDISLTGLDGEYMQIRDGWNITESRSYSQLMVLTGRNNTLDCTFTFSKSIKYVTFVCEAYSKYVHNDYTTLHNVDFDTYLQVNDTRIDITGHQQADTDETKTLKYAVNGTTMRVQVPNEHIGDEKINRLMVYKMIIEY